MRNLEDCKAEVFRRSEERIKERKRIRNRVLTCCIPLCLLLVAGGLYLGPLLEPVDESAKSSGMKEIPDRELGGLPESDLVGSTTSASVEITDKTGPAEVSLRVTDAETVEALDDFMAMYFDTTTVKESMTDGQGRDTIIDEYELRVKYGLDDKLTDYKLVFRRATGETITFRLYENYLYNEENGCVVVLSDAQLSTLTVQLKQAKGDKIDK